MPEMILLQGDCRRHSSELKKSTTIAYPGLAYSFRTRLLRHRREEEDLVAAFVEFTASPKCTKKSTTLIPLQGSALCANLATTASRPLFLVVIAGSVGLWKLSARQNRTLDAGPEKRKFPVPAPIANIVERHQQQYASKSHNDEARLKSHHAAGIVVACLIRLPQQAGKAAATTSGRHAWHNRTLNV